MATEYAGYVYFAKAADGTAKSEGDAASTKTVIGNPRMTTAAVENLEITNTSIEHLELKNTAAKKMLLHE